MIRTAEERRAENEIRLREANERIMRTAGRLGLSVERIPLVCECFRTECVSIIKLRADEYEAVRANPSWFIYAPDHDKGSPDPITVITRDDRFLIVEKGGIAQQLAIDTNPRRQRAAN